MPSPRKAPPLPMRRRTDAMFLARQRHGVLGGVGTPKAVGSCSVLLAAGHGVLFADFGVAGPVDGCSVVADDVQALFGP